MRALALVGILACLVCALSCSKKKEASGGGVWKPAISLSMGQAFIKKSQEDAGELARVGMGITDNDLLLTQMESKMEVKVTPQDLLVIGENSQVIFRVNSEAETPSAAIYLRAGKVFSRIKSIAGARRGTFKVVTPTATAAIRGTDFAVEYDPKTKTTLVETVEGTVEVSGKSGDAQSVAAGQKASVLTGGLPSAPEPMNATDLQTLKEWVEEGSGEERIDLAMAARPPSPANQPPSVHGAAVASVAVGTELKYRLTASDPEGDPVLFRIEKGPAGITLDSVSGTLAWVPSEAGSFPVVISASDRENRVRKELSIKVIGAVEAALQIDPPAGSTKTKFTLSAAKSASLAKLALQYAWDLDNNGQIDMDFSESAVITHQFEKTGKHEVRLIVRDSAGRSSEAIAKVGVNDPPKPVIRVAPPTGPIGTVFKLDGSGSEDSFDPLDRLKFRWDINADGKWDYPPQGRTKESAAASHTYAQPGTYTAILEVEDSEGGLGRDSASIVVFSPVQANAGSDLGAPVNSKVKLSGTGTDRDGKIVKYEWDFNGDGKFDWSSPTTGETMTVYKKEGIYKAILQVTSSTGSKDDDTAMVKIENAQPKALVQSPVTARVNSPVKLNGKGQDPDSKIVALSWDFDGDGRADWKGDSTSVTHIYKKAGTYRAVFRVVADDKKTDSAIVEVRITNEPPKAFAGEDIVSKKNRNLEFIAKGEDADGSIVKYEWDWNADGKFDTSLAQTKIKHRFSEYSYAVLRVTDSDGATGLDTVRIVICPEGMVTVEEKKYCMDRFEWPNKKGDVPLADVTWTAAAAKCREAGKRLCTADEWLFACRTGQERNFPYGFQYGASTCNTKDQAWIKRRGVAASGKFPECISAQEIFDMSGNLMEWTDSGVEAQMLARGGSYENPADGADCTAQVALDPTKKYFFTGFRCCK